MAAIPHKRCDACRELCVASDHGRVKAVGETRYVETLPNGDTVFRCSACGALVVWERQPQNVR